MIEKWREIKGFEGLYEVSNTGKVRSLGRTIITERLGTPYVKSYPPRDMALSHGKDGYLVLNLHKNGKHYSRSVHRLVAEAFISNPDGLPQINHKDENRENNCSDNLEWCDAKYNNNYGDRTEKSIAHKRKKVACIKNGEVIEIYPSQAEAGRQLNIEPSAISLCCNGKIQHAYGYEWKFVK